MPARNLCLLLSYLGSPDAATFGRQPVVLPFELLKGIVRAGLASTDLNFLDDEFATMVANRFFLASLATVCRSLHVRVYRAPETAICSQSRFR